MASALDSATEKLSNFVIDAGFASSVPNLQKNLHLLNAEQVIDVGFASSAPNIQKNLHLLINTKQICGDSTDLSVRRIWVLLAVVCLGLLAR